MNSIRNAALGVISAAVISTVLMVTNGSPAQGQTARVPATYPAIPQAMTRSYVVNIPADRHGQLLKAERLIQSLGGTVIQRWPEIGVLIVHSNVPNFATRVIGANAKEIQSIGPTRTAPMPDESSAAPPAASPGHRKRTLTLAGFDASPSLTGNQRPDPYEGYQWGNKMVRSDQANGENQGSPGVVVAVVDSGIEADHPDLVAQVDQTRSVNCSGAGVPDTSPTGWWPTTSGHGTHVAGIINAARNGIGVVGVSPGVRVASVKVVDDNGFIYPENAICGAMWTAMKRIPIANHSYFVDPFTYWCDDQPNQAPALEAIARAFAYANSQGVVSTAPAGNDSYDLAHKTIDVASPTDTKPVPRNLNGTCKHLPAELPDVVTVSALNADKDLALFSNYGQGIIDVTAPGEAILSTYIGHFYAELDGTSMAAPYAAGVLALLKTRHSAATPAQLTTKLYAQANPITCPPSRANCTGPTDDNSYFGHGVVDALHAVRG